MWGLRMLLFHDRASARVDGVRADAMGSHMVGGKRTECEHPCEDLHATKTRQEMGKLPNGLCS